MGLTLESAYKIAENIREFSITGDVLTLGRQDIWLSFEPAMGVLLKTGFAKQADNQQVHIENSALNEDKYFNDRILVEKKAKHISDKFWFDCLGLKVKSVDVSKYEGADFIHDLNDPETPECLREGFDLIFDGGTIEHVFHVPNALKNIYNMLKPNGVIIHSLPTNNYVDHGFYQFSPTFFYDYYGTNNFELLQCQFCSFIKDPETSPMMCTQYFPGKLDRFSYGGLDQRQYFTWFVGRKTDKSTCINIPQQGLYAKNINWSKKRDGECQ